MAAAGTTAAACFAALRDGDLTKYRECVGSRPWNSIRDSEGTSILHVCVWLGHHDLAQALLNQLPDCVDIADAEGQTPLMWAVLKGEDSDCLPMMRLLISSGANIDAQDTNGATPLMLAAQVGQRLAASFLVMRGALLAAKDRQGNSAAHWAAYSGSADILYLLQSHGANMDAEDNDKRTPLHRAAQKNHKQCVLMLIDDSKGQKRAADPKKVDKMGRTALDFAKHLNNKDVVKTFRNSTDPSARAVNWLTINLMPVGYATAVFLAFVLWYTCLLPATKEQVPLFNYGGFTLFCMWLVTWVHVMRSNPGTASTKVAKDELRRSLDSHLSDSLKANDVCYTCLINKPVRSKHCPKCGICVYKMDHHCYWVANCIGENNDRSFTAMLTMQFTGHCIYLFLCYMGFRAGAVFATWFLTVQFFTVLALNIFGLLFTYSMTKRHWDNAALNLTTNELFNWKRYAHLHDINERGEAVFRNPFHLGSPTGNLRHFWIRNGRGPFKYSLDPIGDPIV